VRRRSHFDVRVVDGLINVRVIVQRLEVLLIVFGYVKVDDKHQYQQHQADDQLAKYTIVVQHVNDEHCRE